MKLLLRLASAIVLLIPSLIRSQQPKKPKPTICVVDFSNKSGATDLTENANEILSVLLTESGNFRVLERDKIKKLLNEQAISETFLVDNEASAVRVGKMVGADLILTGRVLAYDHKGSTFNGYGVRTVTYTDTIKVSIKVLATNTGEIIYGKLLNESKEGRKTDSGSTFNSGTEHDLLEAALTKAVNDLSEILPARYTPAATAGARYTMVEYQSTPKGADVMLDGAMIGNTPIKFKTEEGMHKLTMTYAGHETWEKQIKIMQGTAVNAVLKKIKEKEGDLHIIIEERKR